ncbi:MAG: zf-HC2 domain-containing protein [Thermacetogeniaceae bacterium]
MGGDVRKGVAIGCEEAEGLFFQRFDEGISASEEDALRAHAASCEECRRSFSEWEALRSALRSPELKVKPPAGFAAQVMARIAEEAPEEATRKPAASFLLMSRLRAGIQRRGLAAAAVVIAILTGSLSLASRLPNLRTAENTPGYTIKRVVQEERDAERKVADIRQTAPGGSTKAQPEKLSSPSSSRPAVQEEPAGKPSAASPGTAADAAKVSSGSSAGSEKVFLNKPRAITTTILKLRVSSLEDARSSALSIARSEGASLQSEFTAQNNGHRDVILRLTAPEEKAQSLISRLTSVGSLMSPPQVSREDITASFASTVKEYQALQAQLATASDDEERERLKSQIFFLESQLQRWDEESGKQVIIVLLEE